LGLAPTAAPAGADHSRRRLNRSAISPRPDASSSRRSSGSAIWSGAAQRQSISGV